MLYTGWRGTIFGFAGVDDSKAIALHHLSLLETNRLADQNKGVFAQTVDDEVVTDDISLYHSAVSTTNSS